MANVCKICRYPLSSEERAKYGDRCRWCGAPEWHLDSERSALAELGQSPYPNYASHAA